MSFSKQVHMPANKALTTLPSEWSTPYRSVTRSLKYVLLFLGLVFLTYFVFEATTGKRVHPAQYVLVGTAQIIFYLLLLSLSEKMGFDIAFLCGRKHRGAAFDKRRMGVFQPITRNKGPRHV